MDVRRETAIRELEGAQELLEQWRAKLSAVYPVRDGMGNVIDPGDVPADMLVGDFLGEKQASAFRAELVVIAHKLEGLAST